MTEQTKNDCTLTRTASLECRALEDGENSARYEISFSSEIPYARWNVPEILSHSSGSVDLSRLEAGGTLLFSHGHDPNFGRVPIGRVVRAWLDESARKCRAEIELDEEDESCMRLKSKLDRGMLAGVSVGYTVDEWLSLKKGQRSSDGRFSGPAEVAARWTPYEISLEPTPADASVGLGKKIKDNEEDAVMPDKTQDQNLRRDLDIPAAAENIPSAGERNQTGQAPIQPDMVSAERTRVLEISALCRGFGMDAEEFVRNGDSLDAVRAAVLERLQAERRPVAPAVSGHITMERDEMDKVRAAAADGLLLRGGVTLENPAPGASEFRGMSLHDVAVECLTRSGVAGALRLSRDELFRRSMTPDSAFTAIAADVANRTVLATHTAAPTTFQHWTRKGTLKDFRPTEVFEISEAGELDEIPQNGAFTEGKLFDKAIATKRLLTFGKRVSFTRQLFINDDIEMVTRTLQAYTLAFARGINRAVYALLKENPKMYDGNPLFCSAHGNLAMGCAPGTSAFSEARRLMRGQSDLSGKIKLNLSPAYVLTSAADETAVEMLLASLADPSGNNSGVANVFKNRMQPIVDAELDVDDGPQPYFFAASPNLIETIEVSYLNGVEAPTVQTNQDFDHLGLQFRIFGDRGITLLGYRGFVKNPGN